MSVTGKMIAKFKNLREAVIPAESPLDVMVTAFLRMMFFSILTLLAGLTLLFVLSEVRDSSLNRERATLETIVTSKEVGHYYDRDSRNIVSNYRYSYETHADGADCDRIRAQSSVKVAGKNHECARDSLQVTEAEWNKLQVGQVLKRVEIK